MRDSNNEQFDPDFYRGLYPDLANMSAAEATDHYRDHGAREGRYPNQTIYLGQFEPKTPAEPVAPPSEPTPDLPHGAKTHARETQVSDRPARHHLLLGGTGRAGTTFMVQYLSACGLDTHSSRHPNEQLEEHANAGLEDLPTGDDSDLPYVIKTPWLYEFIDRLVEQKGVVIDAVIVAMRDIVEAATSRVMLEMRARLANDGLTEEHTRWETWGTTPGGLVYSLNPVDQARILALGFHQVIHTLVKHDIPIVFLDFPRFIEDGNYLYEQLKPVLGDGFARETALAAHSSVARVDLVRVGAELEGAAASEKRVGAPICFPAHATIDRTTLFRELKRMKGALESARTRSRMLEEALRRDRELNIQLKDKVQSLNAQLETERRAMQLDRAKDTELQSRLVADLIERLDSSNDELDRIEQSIAWRAVRAVQRLFRRN